MADPEKEAMMRKTFQMFDQGKTGFIDSSKIGFILSSLGHSIDEAELAALIEKHDSEGSGKIDFNAFAEIAGFFLEEEDDEAMQRELKEAFRLYDREGNGYITTAVLRELLQALDESMTKEELDGMIEEIDADGSGTIDFEEFVHGMTGE